jgi:hypothetical protein
VTSVFTVVFHPVEKLVFIEFLNLKLAAKMFIKVLNSKLAPKKNVFKSGQKSRKNLKNRNSVHFFSSKVAGVAMKKKLEQKHAGMHTNMSFCPHRQNKHDSHPTDQGTLKML